MKITQFQDVCRPHLLPHLRSTSGELRLKDPTSFQGCIFYIPSFENHFPPIPPHLGAQNQGILFTFEIDMFNNGSL